MSKKEIELKNLTNEQIENLKNLGIEIKIKSEWICTCPFCGKEFKRETQKQASKSISIHFGKCKFYKFTKAAQNIMPNKEKFKMGDIVFLLTGKFPKNYKPHVDNEETLKRIREISESMEK